MHADRSTPNACAAAAGLRYVHDGEPGIVRRRRGRGFSYHRPDGSVVRDAATLARIRSLAIPPAYASVWVCADTDGHLQATGRDARGRKQYRYHPRWHDTRHAERFGRLADFMDALPAVRAAVDADLGRPGLPREKVVAAVVRLLEMTHVRVGNVEYARENRSYGLTTLLCRHATVEGTRVSLRFRGKSGVRHSVRVTDRRVARIVARCQELPGQELFQYADDDGEYRQVTSDDVNAYLRTVAGDFTAKDFRTRAGTLLAAVALRDLPTPSSAAEGRRVVHEAVGQVASALGNTKAVCRKHYIHPAIIDAYLAGHLPSRLRSADESGVIAFLRRARHLCGGATR